jgi:hypothetical protein
MEEECERLGSEEWKRSASGWGQRNGRGVRAGGVRRMEEECERVGSEANERWATESSHSCVVSCNGMVGKRVESRNLDSLMS